MSLPVCSLQEVCPEYENGTKENNHYIRLTHPCKKFLASSCETGAQLEMFLSGEPIACDISKGKEFR